MKKFLSLLLVLALCLSLSVPALAAEDSTVTPRTETVRVDGKTTAAISLCNVAGADGSTLYYTKLRDLAYILNGTGAQFSVEWDNGVKITTGQPYTPNGSEQSAPFTGEQTRLSGPAIYVNGELTQMDAFTLVDASGGGYTYVSMELNDLLGITTEYNQEEKQIEFRTESPAGVYITESCTKTVGGVTTVTHLGDVTTYYSGNAESVPTIATPSSEAMIWLNEDGTVSYASGVYRGKADVGTWALKNGEVSLSVTGIEDDADETTTLTWENGSLTLRCVKSGGEVELEITSRLVKLDTDNLAGIYKFSHGINVTDGVVTKLELGETYPDSDVAITEDISVMVLHADGTYAYITAWRNEAINGTWSAENGNVIIDIPGAAEGETGTMIMGNGALYYHWTSTELGMTDTSVMVKQDMNYFAGAYLTASSTFTLGGETITAQAGEAMGDRILTPGNLYVVLLEDGTATYTYDGRDAVSGTWTLVDGQPVITFPEREGAASKVTAVFHRGDIMVTAAAKDGSWTQTTICEQIAADSSFTGTYKFSKGTTIKEGTVTALKAGENSMTEDFFVLQLNEDGTYTITQTYVDGPITGKWVQISRGTVVLQGSALDGEATIGMINGGLWYRCTTTPETVCVYMLEKQ